MKTRAVSGTKKCISRIGKNAGLLRKGQDS